MHKKKTSTTPSQRHLYLIDRSSLYRGKPFYDRTKGSPKSGGRNNKGRVTIRHRGGGHKRKYREIDFKGLFREAWVLGVEQDPNRSAWIARLCEFEGGKNENAPLTSKRYYILAPRHLSRGSGNPSLIKSGANVPPQIGNRLPLKEMPLGTNIHNLEIKVGKGGQFIRSAGTSGLLLHKGENEARVRLPSGLQPFVPLNCEASIGSLANQDFKNQVLGKAGRSRWLGRRPKVRGVAMNPIDHPHGGGEGRSSGGRPSVTPWGRPTKGPSTRSKRVRKAKKGKEKGFPLAL